MSARPWIGVDLDGTLAKHPEGSFSHAYIGPPIERMVERVKEWLADGKHVRIMTARVAGIDPYSREAHLRQALIQAWCLEHLGLTLPVTATKDMYMTELWDDRAVQVVTDTGRTAVSVALEMDRAHC